MKLSFILSAAVILTNVIQSCESLFKFGGIRYTRLPNRPIPRAPARAPARIPGRVRTAIVRSVRTIKRWYRKNTALAHGILDGVAGGVEAVHYVVNSRNHQNEGGNTENETIYDETAEVCYELFDEIAQEVVHTNCSDETPSNSSNWIAYNLPVGSSELDLNEEATEGNSAIDTLDLMLNSSVALERSGRPGGRPAHPPPKPPSIDKNKSKPSFQDKPPIENPKASDKKPREKESDKDKSSSNNNSDKSQQGREPNDLIASPGTTVTNTPKSTRNSTSKNNSSSPGTRQNDGITNSEDTGARDISGKTGLDVANKIPPGTGGFMGFLKSLCFWLASFPKWLWGVLVTIVSGVASIVACKWCPCTCNRKSRGEQVQKSLVRDNEKSSAVNMNFFISGAPNPAANSDERKQQFELTTLV